MANSNNNNNLWALIGGIATLIVAVFTVASVKQGKDWLCEVAVLTAGIPFFCEYTDVEFTLHAFEYRDSSDGVSTADTCISDDGIDRSIGRSNALIIKASPNTAICWELKIYHPDFARTVVVPAQVLIETPPPLYETRNLTDNALVGFDTGVVTKVSKRLIVVGGDAFNWPIGTYTVTVTPHWIATTSPIRGTFELRSHSDF